MDASPEVIRDRPRSSWDDERTMNLSPYIEVYETKLPKKAAWTGLYDHRGEKIMYPTVTRRPVGFLHSY